MKIKKNGLQKIIILAVVGAIVLPTVSKANSMPTFTLGDEGVHGVTLLEKDCPIEVEKEILTFNLQNFPEEYYVTSNQFKNYTGEVTAEYTFYNPTDEEISARLAFPFGNKPEYLSDEIEEKLDGEWWKKEITVNGKSVETNLRFTYCLYGDFDAYKECEKLIDGYMEDEFYRPDLPVTKYTYDIQTDEIESENLDACITLNMGNSNSKMAIKGSIDNWDGTEKAGTLNLFVEDSKAEFYVLGEDNLELEWSFRDEWEETEVEGKATFSEKKTMTFEEFALSHFSENMKGSKSDQYNAVVSSLKEWEEATGIIEDYSTSSVQHQLMYWYEYEVVYPPKQTVDNSVTAPIYPSIEVAYEPPIYEYKYLLSPAELWSDFGDMEIRINTPFYMTDCSMKGFEKTENGYILVREGLPGEEFEFVLSESENPKMDPDIRSYRLAIFFYTVGIPVLLAGGTVLVYFIIRRRRKKENS